MSFLIGLFQNTEDEIVCNKNPTWLGSITSVNLRDDYDVFEPDIIIQTDEADIKDTLLANYNNANRSFINDVASGKINYMTITENNTIRYYFVRLHEVIQANVIRIKLYEDVLKTRNALIRSCSGVVRRNENNYNLLINDNRINTYADPVVRRKKFTGGTGSFAPSNPSTFIIATGSQPTISASGLTGFTVSVTRNGDLTAKNGGAIVFIPYAKELNTGLVNGSWADTYNLLRLGEPVPNWVICPSGAIYGRYYEEEGQAFLDDGYCYICQITGLERDPDSTSEIYYPSLAPVDRILWGNSFNCKKVGSDASQASSPVVCFHVGGELNWAQQGSGADLMINSVWSDAGRAALPAVRYANISFTNTNYFRFNARW